MSLILRPFPQLEIQFTDRQASPFTVQAIKALSAPYAPLLPKLPPQTSFLHQTHGTTGAIFTNPAQLQHFTNLGQDGDYLLTTVPNTALGVLTADCLPVIFYAPDIGAVAAVHAGWRGSVAGILTKVIRDLRALNSAPAQLKVWFGPAAGVCCYAVGPEFAGYLTSAPQLPSTANVVVTEPTTDSATMKFNLAEILISRLGQTYFNLARYNYELLLLNGILSQNIDLTCNLCTICNLQFGSYRRDGVAADLQVSQVVLKS